ncbi:MAG: murein DD-endopeptidase MepM/ murein hydrolase activator NlpD [Paraglaciecola sp.]
MSSPILTGLLWLMLVVIPSPRALAYCLDDWACVDIIETEHKIEFWLSNNKAYPITSTLEVKTRNLSSPKQSKNEYTQTLVLRGFQRILALSLVVTDPQLSRDYSERFNWAPGSMHARHNVNYRYSVPYKKGEHYPIVQGFGGGYSHQGASKYAIDIAMPVGTPIHAARDGVVIDIVEKHHRGGASRSYAKYANYVVILHSDDTTGEYYHLRKNGAAVEVGAKVVAGQHIAYSGNTGFSSLPHLHFAVYKAKSHGNYQSLPFEFNQKVSQPDW